jgi:hypothetical protein
MLVLSRPPSVSPHVSNLLLRFNLYPVFNQTKVQRVIEHDPGRFEFTHVRLNLSKLLARRHNISKTR